MRGCRAESSGAVDVQVHGVRAVRRVQGQVAVRLHHLNGVVLVRNLRRLALRQVLIADAVLQVLLTRVAAGQGRVQDVHRHVARRDHHGAQAHRPRAALAGVGRQRQQVLIRARSQDCDGPRGGGAGRTYPGGRRRRAYRSVPARKAWVAPSKAKKSPCFTVKSMPFKASMPLA